METRGLLNGTLYMPENEEWIELSVPEHRSNDVLIDAKEARNAFVVTTDHCYKFGVPRLYGFTNFDRIGEFSFDEYSWVMDVCGQTWPKFKDIQLMQPAWWNAEKIETPEYRAYVTEMNMELPKIMIYMIPVVDGAEAEVRSRKEAVIIRQNN